MMHPAELDPHLSAGDGSGNLLSGLRVIEAASFIAAPVCALTLAQMGAEVIRLDQIGGGPDYDRWPLSRSGHSLYWQGLNKGKKSVAIDLRTGEGRALAQEIISAPAPQGATFVTNFPADGFLAHDRLAAHRPDLLTLRVTGWADGSSAFDYTVNAALGFPFQTGPADLPANEPVNSALPAWDFITGNYAAAALLAAHRRRCSTGQGFELRVPLGNVGLAVASQLGQIAEVSEGQPDRPRLGNAVFGTFGRDFATRDGGRVMIVAITPPQWKDLVDRLGIAEAVAEIEQELSVSFATDGAVRFDHRARLFVLLAQAVSTHDEAGLKRLFAGSRVCWGPYRTLSQALHDPGLIGGENPLFSRITHSSGVAYPTAGTPGFIVGEKQAGAGRAPALGEHTEPVLADILGLSSGQIARLIDRKIVAISDDRATLPMPPGGRAH